MSYVINTLYKYQNKLVTRLSLSSMTLIDVINSIDLNTQFYISVKDKDTKCYTASYGLPINLLITETPFIDCTTWEEFENLLTEKWVLSYKTQIPGFVADDGTKGFRSCLQVHYPLRYLKEVRDADNILTGYEKWNIEYFDSTIWDRRNIPAFKGVMPDLLLTGVSDTSYKHIVVVCNGHTLYTKYIPAMNDHGEQLLVKDGARHLWSTTLDNYPEIMCLDFSLLGDIRLYKFSEFKKYNENYDGTSNLYFRFPDIDLSQYTPLVVLCGILYYPFECGKYGNTVQFDISNTTIADMLLKKAYDTKEDTPGTLAIETISPETYLKTTMWEEDTPDAFIILIKNNKVFTEAHFGYKFATKNWSQLPKDTYGLIRQRTTGELLGYIDSKYHTADLMYFNKLPDLYRLVDQPHKTVVGTTRWSCQHTNRPYLPKFTGSNDDNVIIQEHVSTLDLFNLVS